MDCGVLLAVLSFFMLSRSGKKEGIDFKHNRWIGFIVLAAVLGAVSGLYDKYLMASPADGGVGIDRMAVQSWYNLYQMLMMLGMMAILWWPTRKRTHTLPLGLDHHRHQRLSQRGRLCLFLFAQPSRCHDFHRLDDPQGQRHRELPLRRSHLP
jgi:hypothetical protein